MSTLDQMMFAPNQQVTPKILIKNSEFLMFAKEKILHSESKDELFRTVMALDNQSKLRTVRRIVTMAKNSEFIELKKISGDMFVTISKCRKCFSDNGYKVEVTFYQRYNKSHSASVSYYSISEAVLQCVKDGYHVHCDGYYNELFNTDKVLNRINHRLALLSALKIKSNRTNII
ncbi:hypothetical protein [Photobacterium phosphoreum]|uniref:hypothetical protein n=1 Tax=Photobacterium phosphoreum TaxID=659 RepID=UPI0011B2231B|nr:hypothetical protein [Photobacterium phosphoreum]